MFKRLAFVILMIVGIGWGWVHGAADQDADPASLLAALQGTTPAPPGTWFFRPIAGMACANGSPTGIGINFAKNPSSKLLIYLEGGGGCWDSSTCNDSFHIRNANLGGFDASAFEQMLVTGMPQYVPPIPANYGAHGLWDRTTSANPFANHHYVFIPYCTADFHMGSVWQSPTDGLSHVGHSNMTMALSYLSRIFTPTSTTAVVLLGGSAGGFGALWNFPQTQAAFPSVSVTLIAESSPPLPAPFLSSHLEEAWRLAWGLDESKPALAPSTHLFPYVGWLAQTHPNNRFAFVGMTGDVVLASCFGVPLWGANSLSNGLFSLRRSLQQSAPNIRFFWIPAVGHTYIHQDPSTWPAPPPPFGDNKRSLGSWLSLQTE